MQEKKLWYTFSLTVHLPEQYGSPLTLSSGLINSTLQISLTGLSHGCQLKEKTMQDGSTTSLFVSYGPFGTIGVNAFLTKKHPSSFKMPCNISASETSPDQD
ncbi:hypothetical protein CRYUN_Cryun36dG0028800 [Craigia yunnanensis]